MEKNGEWSTRAAAATAASRHYTKRRNAPPPSAGEQARPPLAPKFGLAGRKDSIGNLVHKSVPYHPGLAPSVGGMAGRAAPVALLCLVLGLCMPAATTGMATSGVSRTQTRCPLCTSRARLVCCCSRVQIAKCGLTSACE